MQKLTQIQPAVKKETERVAVCTAAGVFLMWAGFAVFHFIFPGRVPLDYTVFLGGICGGVIAVLNFFLMGLTVQQVAASSDEEMGRMRMRASYSKRMLMQMLWVIIAAAAPCFHVIAGMLPLLFPGIGIKLTGIIKK